MMNDLFENSEKENYAKVQKSSNYLWHGAKNNVNVESFVNNKCPQKSEAEGIGFYDRYKAFSDSYFPSNAMNDYMLVSPIISVAKKQLISDDHRIHPEKIENWEKMHDRHNSIICGALDIIKNYSVTKPIARTYENFMEQKLIREATVPLKSFRHAKAALEIGLGIDINNSRNLASTSDRFGKNYDDYFNDKDSVYKKNNMFNEGRNAIRHTIWQGVLSSKYGPKVARDIGDSHETRPYMDVSKRVFYEKADADMVTDLLNNKIGRMIGAKYPDYSRKQIALRVLEEYWRTGLYSYEQGADGRWYVERRKLSDYVFYDLYKKYKCLDEYGF